MFRELKEFFLVFHYPDTILDEMRTKLKNVVFFCTMLWKSKAFDNFLINHSLINSVPRTVYVFNTYSADAAHYIILSHVLTEAGTIPVLSCSSLKIVTLMTTDGGL